jgi:hypothetical protein
MSMEDMRALQLETVKNSLEEYKQRSHELRDENEALKREREVRESEARQIISYLRNDAEKKDVLIESLRDAIEQQRERFAREREGDRLSAAKRLKEAEDDFHAREKRLEDSMAQLNKELATLLDFKERKATLEGGLEHERHERLELEENHKEAVAQMERKFFEEKAKLQREAKQMLAEIKKSSQEEAVERLDASTKKVLFENRRMAEELRLQVQETDELQKLSRKRDDENKRLRRDVELNEDALKEYAKTGFRQTREIKDLAAKVKSLERSLGQVVKEYERKAQLVADAHDRRSQELELESSGMRQLLRLKSKELANVKRLAQLILEKRNEVETFLLESIEEVKVRRSRTRATRPLLPCDLKLAAARAWAVVRAMAHRARAHACSTGLRPFARGARCAGAHRSGAATADQGRVRRPARYAAADHTRRPQGDLAPAALDRGARRYRRPDVVRPRARASATLLQNQQLGADAAHAAAPA